jgi:cytochrome d ubiquinol oxidase subunit I
MLTPTREMGPLLTKWSWRIGILTMGFPLVANSFGWIFTEMGRQPWSVFGLLKTANSASPNVSIGMQIGAFTTFTVLYAILAVIEVRLLAKYAKAGPDVEEQPPAKDPVLRGPGADQDADQPMAFAY